MSEQIDDRPALDADIRTVAANGIEIAYETFGDPGDPAILLVMGLGTQMLAWPDPLCARLADWGGFHHQAVYIAEAQRLGIPTVTEVLLYHVVPNAKVTGKDVLSGPFSQRISMANGEKLRVTVLSRSARFPVILLGDKDGKFFNDSVVRSKINAVETDNTVVHGISGVLLPTL